MSERPKLKLGFTDYYDTLDGFFLNALEPHFEIERDDANPDYLIFCDETYGTNNRQYDPNKVVKIFFTGENRRPWNYQSHYAISFEHGDHRNWYRLPLYVLDNWVNTELLDLPDFTTKRMMTKDDLESRVNFCTFVAGNGGCERRNNAFHMVNEYKKVSSGGPLFNNIGHTIPRGSDAQIHKLDFLQTGKFHLCYENGSYPGYVTEKIAHAFAANTIPIYWGSPTVEMDFNPDAFINRHNYETDEQMMEAVRFIDEFDDAWLTMVNEPVLADNNFTMDLDRFARWFKRVVFKG